MKVDRRMYQIACSFPALRRKGAMQGDIPGIRPDGFYDIEHLIVFLPGYRLRPVGLARHKALVGILSFYF